MLQEDKKMPEKLRFCFNIDASNDTFFQGKTSCLPFTRSDSICNEDNIRQQFNAITSYIDASNVYGSDPETADKLRSKSDGKMTTNYLGPALPTRGQCKFENAHEESFDDLVGGDVRAIEQPALAGMHSLFISEHNRIAELLKENVPEANDEEIYQVSRKILGAEFQNVVYDEFLPIVLGNKTMEKYRLALPYDNEEGSDYNSSVVASISNEFATVAYRFGHSLIPNQLLHSHNPIRSSKMSCPLHQHFFTFDEFVLGTDKSGKGWQNMMDGLQYQESPKMDASVANNVRDFLFCNGNCSLPGGHGQDLAARNIQRGRDHGLQPYLKFREFCNLSIPDNWFTRPEDVSEQYWRNLQKVYRNVSDIDPFPGGLSESAVEGGLVGETFACIIGLQFARLKEGDRFFFTNPENGSKGEMGLPRRAKEAIRKRKLGDIICDNTDLENISPEVMRMTGKDQQRSCEAGNKLIYSDILELLPTESPVPSPVPVPVLTPVPSPVPEPVPSPVPVPVPSPVPVPFPSPVPTPDPVQAPSVAVPDPVQAPSVPAPDPV